MTWKARFTRTGTYDAIATAGSALPFTEIGFPHGPEPA